LTNTKSYQWIHPLSDIVSGLLGAGLQIEMLHEHEVLPWKPFSMMVAAGQGYYRLPDGAPSIPLALSLRARKRNAAPA
jgi:hypothetical protein